MPTAKLTKTYIDKLADDGADTTHWCADLPGFGVRVQPGGRKTYMVRYRTTLGTQRKLRLGRASDFPPDKAREMARAVFYQVAQGKDPAAEREEARGAPSVDDLQERYTREHATPFKKPASQRADEMNWRLHILPAMGRKRVREVAKADVLKLFGGLSAKPATANQVLALLSKAMGLAETWGYRDANTNPCRGVRKLPVAQAELILSPAQIGQLDDALTAMVAEHAIRPDFADFIRLLMLTGCRKSEVMLARAEWVDLHQGLLLLPDSKVGQRRIRLAPAAAAIAKGLVEDGREWLIRGRRAGQPLRTPYKVWKAVKARAGLPARLRLHDLRHTAGSLGHRAGLSQRQIADMLGHKQLATTERYLHGFAGDAERAADKVGQLVADAWRQRDSEPPPTDL